MPEYSCHNYVFEYTAHLRAARHACRYRETPGQSNFEGFFREKLKAPFVVHALGVVGKPSFKLGFHRLPRPLKSDILREKTQVQVQLNSTRSTGIFDKTLGL